MQAAASSVPQKRPGSNISNDDAGASVSAGQARNCDDAALAAKRRRAYWSPTSYLRSHPEDCDTKELVLIVVQREGLSLRFASERLKGDLEVVVAATRSNPKAIHYCTRKGDREFILSMIARLEGGFLSLAPGLGLEHYQDDKEVVLQAAKQNGRVLENASERLREDHEVVLAAVNSKGTALQFVSASWQNCKEMVLTAVREDGHAIFFASDELRDDKEVVLEAVQNMKYMTRKGSSVSYRMCYTGIPNGKPFASARLQQDRDVLLAVAAVDHCIMNAASLPLETRQMIRSDRDFALHIIKHVDPEYLYLPSFDESIRQDKEIVLAAVKKNGTSLEHASEELKADREVVLAAVTSDLVMMDTENDQQTALNFASEELQLDTEIIMAAVKTNGNVLRFLPADFTRSAELLLEGLKSIKAILQKEASSSDRPARSPVHVVFLIDTNLFGKTLVQKLSQTAKILVNHGLLEDTTTSSKDFDDNHWIYDDEIAPEKFAEYAERQYHDLLNNQQILERIGTNTIGKSFPAPVINLISSFSLKDEIKQAKDVKECLFIAAKTAEAYDISIPDVFFAFQEKEG